MNNQPQNETFPKLAIVFVVIAGIYLLCSHEQGGRTGVTVNSAQPAPSASK